MTRQRMRHGGGLALALVLGCSGGAAGGADGGVDAGLDAGAASLSDGGALGAPCRSLDQCAGNPLDVGQGAPYAVICASGACTLAGGADSYEVVKLAFGGSLSSRLPSYLQVYLLAPALVTGGTLDCPTLLAGLDAGTLALRDTTKVNPLSDTYEQNVGIQTSQDIEVFPLNPAASGPGEVLYLEGYLDIGLNDGGAALLGRVCATFDDSGGDAGTVSATMTGPW